MPKRMPVTWLNAGLGVFGAEVVRAGLVNAHASQINKLTAEVEVTRAKLRQATDRDEAAAVRQALDLSTESLPPLVTPTSRYTTVLARAGQLASRDLFTLDGELLPCWREGDLDLYDDWLTHPRNFPVYYALFEQLAVERPALRLLEVGVRTGYIGTAFARATVAVPAFYLGIDPNQYLPDGLKLAAATFRRLRQRQSNFSYALIEGYSWRRSIQNSLEHGGPFDLIHIDGDHSLEGKLIDLNLARRLVAPDGLVLVDDLDYHPPVADAIRRALSLGWYRRCERLATMRGLALLEI